MCHDREVAFVDEVSVFVRGGRGGDGSASLLSEPFKPRGGPDGGDGGRGGDVVFEVTPGLHDLAQLADRPHIRAGPGGPGRSSKRTGADGEHAVIPVPDGTVVHDDEGPLADLVGVGSRAVVARGGRGGRGNASLASPRQRVPRTAEAGELGEEKRLRVELRVVADVGLVGLPNAGKSTLLSKLTAARPKIAEYPFTTLSPNLGVGGDDTRRFVIADIPGLIEGAHEGKGLGHRFLRHVMRCRMLVIVVDLSSERPEEDLATIERELRAYDPELAARRRLVVGAKSDLVEDADERVGRLGRDAIAVSAVTGVGLDELATRVERMVAEAEGEVGERVPTVVLRPGRPRFVIRREGDRYRVVGRNVERWVAETDFEDPRRIVELQKRLVREGVERQLVAAGARRGDEVVIGDRAFEFIPEEG